MTTEITVAEPTRFEIAREAAAQAASVALCTEILAVAAQGVLRSAGLLMPTAVAGARGGKINKQEVSRTLAAVIKDLQDVVAEIGE